MRNKIPFKRMARANGIRRKLYLNAGSVPANQTRELAAIYLDMVKIWEDGARDLILPAYTSTLTEMVSQDRAHDAISDIEIAIATVNGYAVQAAVAVRNVFSRWANTSVARHLRQLVSRLKYATNIDLQTMVGPSDVQETVESVLARNTSLIRNVSDQTRQRIADIVMRGIQQRTPARDVAKEIASATGMARDRALRIASDQSVKMTAMLDKERQLQLGFNHFEWQHSGKLHYRPEHKARNGKVFAWTGYVAKNDPPGFLPFCGCKARGVIDPDEDEADNG